jgi:hypothetical protein
MAQFHQVSYQQTYVLPEPSTIGGIIIFRSSLLEPDNGPANDGTTLNLINKGGDIMLHLSFRPYANIIVFNTRPAKGRWGHPEERVSFQGQFDRGKNITIIIYEHPDRYQVLFNGKTGLYFNKRIYGDTYSIMYEGRPETCFSDTIAFETYANWAALVSGSR